MENPKQHQINLSYETWEPLLRDKLVQLEQFLEAIKYDLSCVGMSRKDANVFLDEKIEQFRKQIQEERSKKQHRRAV